MNDVGECTKMQIEEWKTLFRNYRYKHSDREMIESKARLHIVKP